MVRNADELIFYQIYPKSFCDGNGDGVGDVEGILSKIEYLKDLGVNAVWLTPCFESPNADNGYDISDYLSLSPAFGTLEKFEEMLARFHGNGIAVILDLVANHTSTKHPWFVEARKSKDNPYRDYYIWRKTPPNDWQSLFGGSAWEYDGQTGEYYLHSFAIEQADLNWDNPKVREEMKAVVDHWLKKGVDGFRCDVLDMISKDWEKNENGGGPRLHEYVRELFARKETEGIFTVGECWSADAENARLFCGKDRKELTAVFAFHHLCVEEGKFEMEKPPLCKVCGRIAEWQLATQAAGIPATLFLENHDQPRSVSRFGDDTVYRFESATLLGGLVLLHRGVPFLFQGGEIGVTNSHYEDMRAFDDVEEFNFYRANAGKMPEKEIFRRINAGGRDNARRMTPWTAETGKSWIAPYSRQSEINVADDLRSERSVHAFYKKLIALRKSEPCLTKGEYAKIALTEKYYIFERRYQGEKITAVCNFETPSKIDGSGYGEVLLDNYDGDGKGTFGPYRLVVYKKRKE